MFCRKGVLKNFLKAHKKTHMPKSLVNKVTCLHSATLLKEKTPIQVLSDEFCEIFKTFFFTVENQPTASVLQKNTLPIK